MSPHTHHGGAVCPSDITVAIRTLEAVRNLGTSAESRLMFAKIAHTWAATAVVMVACMQTIDPEVAWSHTLVAGISLAVAVAIGAAAHGLTKLLGSRSWFQLLVAGALAALGRHEQAEHVARALAGVLVASIVLPVGMVVFHNATTLAADVALLVLTVWLATGQVRVTNPSPTLDRAVWMLHLACEFLTCLAAVVRLAVAACTTAGLRLGRQLLALDQRPRALRQTVWEAGRTSSWSFPLLRFAPAG